MKLDLTAESEALADLIFHKKGRTRLQVEQVIEERLGKIIEKHEAPEPKKTKKKKEDEE
jgi:hypothetical protein